MTLNLMEIMMKLSTIALVIAAVTAFNATAADKTSSAMTANSVAKAHATASAAQLNQLSQTRKSSFNADIHAQMNVAASNMSKAIANVQTTGAQVQAAQTKSNRKAAVAAVSAPSQPSTPPSYSAPTANTNPAATGSINVNVSSLAPSTPVSVTTNNVTSTVPAGQLPPDTQVQVAAVPAIIGAPSVKGGQQGHDHNGHQGEHSGNGGSNAQGTNSAAHAGFGNGGHAAAGGGRQGGSFHY